MDVSYDIPSHNFIFLLTNDELVIKTFEVLNVSLSWHSIRSKYDAKSKVTAQNVISRQLDKAFSGKTRKFRYISP